MENYIHINTKEPKLKLKKKKYNCILIATLLKCKPKNVVVPHIIGDFSHEVPSRAFMPHVVHLV